MDTLFRSLTVGNKMDELKWIFQRTLITFLSWVISGICLVGGAVLLFHKGKFFIVLGIILILAGIFFVMCALALKKWFFLKGINPTNNTNSSQHSFNTCPSCNCTDIDTKRMPTFGIPGYLREHRCSGCDKKFWTSEER